MRLVPGKLYRVIDTYIHFRLADAPSFRRVLCPKDSLVLFLGKGKYVPQGLRPFRITADYHAYTPYYFLFGEIKIELRKYYNVKLNEILERAEERL